VDEWETVDVAYLYFSEAFNTVSYNVPTEKMIQVQARYTDSEME